LLARAETAVAQAEQPKGTSPLRMHHVYHLIRPATADGEEDLLRARDLIAAALRFEFDSLPSSVAGFAAPPLRRRLRAHRRSAAWHGGVGTGITRQQLLNNGRKVVGPTLCLGDNKSNHTTSQQIGASSRTRYYERAVLLFKRAVLLLILSPSIITTDNMGDIFTKATDKSTFVRMRNTQYDEHTRPAANGS
jgi:hypothetical protein